MELNQPFSAPRGWFGRLAGWWMARSNRPLAVWAAAGLQLQEGDRVLDIGCGPGVSVALAAAQLRSGIVIGIDPSADMRKLAARRNRAAIRRGRAALGQARVSAMPFAGGRFDKVVSVNAIRLWPDPVSDLAEVRRVMRAAARLVVVMHAHGAADASQVRRQQERCLGWIEAAGLQPLEAQVRRVHGMPALRVIAAHSATRARGWNGRGDQPRSPRGSVGSTPFLNGSRRSWWVT